METRTNENKLKLKNTPNPQKFILGCGNFGGVGSLPSLYGRGENQATAFALMKEALRLNIYKFDTANSYGGGESERFIGAFLNSLPNSEADKVYISTKVGNPHATTLGGDPLDLDEIDFQVSSSLQRLGKKSIDLLYIHELSSQTSIKKVTSKLLELINEEKIKGFGLSNVNIDDVKRFYKILAPSNLQYFKSIQNEFHLLKTDDLGELIPFCLENNISYSAYSPLAGGLLTGKYLSGEIPKGSRLSDRVEPYLKFLSEKYHKIIKDHIEISNQSGTTPQEMAVRFILEQPGIESVVIGPRRESHFGSFGFK